MEKHECLEDITRYIKRISRGDEVAFKYVFDYYYPKIRNFAYKVLHEHEYAQEVAQDVMLSFWQMGDKLTEIDNLEAFLKMLSKRRSIDVIRRIQRERQVAEEWRLQADDGANETEDHIFVNETQQILKNGIALLPPQQQKVFQLCRQQGLKYEEVAARMNISHGTVQTHMKLALKFLRQYVRKHAGLTVLLIIFDLF